MEKAILKTLIYADIFDYPLTFREIHKWLIGKKTEPRKLEQAIEKYRVLSIKYQGEKYFFLSGRNKIVTSRVIKKHQSESYFRKAKLVAKVLKIIPWIKLIGISGGLAMENASRKDDLDLFIVTQKNRLWISRLLILGILDLLDQRRKRQDTKKEAAGKICCNLILEEDKLHQLNHDLYTAHEVLQMKVLWERNGVYSKYLSDNEWAFRYLPNWIGEISQKVSKETAKGRTKVKNQNFKSKVKGLDTLEKWAKTFQLKLMKKPEGLERVQDGAVYFHPEDYRQKVLDEYKSRISKA